MAEKKPRRKRKPVTTWKFFETQEKQSFSGPQKPEVSAGKGTSLQRKRKSCPKCGRGVFMAQHKGRITCGKCHYTEFETKKKEESKETQEKQSFSAPKKPKVSSEPKK